MANQDKYEGSAEDIVFETPPPEPNCSLRNCRYFWGVGMVKGDLVPVCQAFPEGIPEEIAYGANPHRVLFPGDGGVHYVREVVV